MAAKEQNGDGAADVEQLDHDLMVAPTLEEQERAGENFQVAAAGGDPAKYNHDLALKLQEEDRLASQQEQQQQQAAGGESGDGEHQQHSPTTAGRATPKKDKDDARDFVRMTSEGAPVSFLAPNNIAATNDDVQENGGSPPTNECSTQPITASPTTPPKAQEMSHSVKWIRWPGSTNTQGATVPIVTQNENGPCPLLALVNVLLLRGQARLEPDVKTVSSQQLLDILCRCINRMTPDQLASYEAADYQRNVDDAMASLPKLLHGIDVNVKFTGVGEFECTPEFLVFDLLNIPLYHGWLVEPERSPVADLVSQYSYNQLVEFIISAKTGTDQSIASASMAEDFLQTTASQLTYRGICELNSTLKDGALCVFFRNNHFSTMLKHEDELFLLVTDQGFLNEPRVVWESLSTVDGDSRFVDMEFLTSPPKRPQVPTIGDAAPLSPDASPQEQLDHDLMVALTLEEQERAGDNFQAAAASGDPEKYDHDFALKLQEEEDRLQQEQQQQQAGGGESGDGEHQQHSPATAGRATRKKDKCTIV